MGGFKRFVTVVFAIAGLLCLAALALPWYGPLTRETSVLLSIDWYYLVVEVLAGITMIGLVVCLIVAIASHKDEAVVVSKLDGGHITVTCDAIASTAAHIVENNSSCTVDDVDVKTKRKGHVKVRLRLAPYTASDVYDGGSALHAQLMSGLGALCGDTLDGVSIEFTEPQTTDDSVGYIPSSEVTTTPVVSSPAGDDAETTTTDSYEEG